MIKKKSQNTKKEESNRQEKKHRRVIGRDLPVKTIIQAIKANHGIGTAVCKALNTDNKALQRWRKKWPEIEEAVQEATEGVLDLAESKLITCIENGEPWAICFILKCKGRHRGWVEKREYDFPTDIKITVQRIVTDERGELLTSNSLPQVTGRGPLRLIGPVQGNS